MSRSRRLWAGTASPMSLCCGPSPRCSARWHPAPRSPGSSTLLPQPARRPSPRSGRHGPKYGRGSGDWPGANSPAADASVIVDIDGVLVLAHSEKQDATATWKKTFGHHPLVAFVDHGPAGSGEPVATLLRPGNAGSNTAADHIATARLALARLPEHLRRGRQTLIRTDSAGGTHAFLDWLSRRGRWLSYSVGMTITDALHQAVLKIPKKAWTPAYDAEGTEGPGAWVAEITDMPDLTPKRPRNTETQNPHQQTDGTHERSRLGLLSTTPPWVEGGGNPSAVLIVGPTAMRVSYRGGQLTGCVRPANDH